MNGFYIECPSKDTMYVTGNGLELAYVKGLLTFLEKFNILKIKHINIRRKSDTYTYYMLVKLYT